MVLFETEVTRLERKKKMFFTSTFNHIPRPVRSLLITPFTLLTPEQLKQVQFVSSRSPKTNNAFVI